MDIQYLFLVLWTYKLTPLKNLYHQLNVNLHIWLLKYIISYEARTYIYIDTRYDTDTNTKIGYNTDTDISI
jgi:hypothetical protein